MRLTLQLISGISIVLQKLLKYFKGTIISTFFLLKSLGAFPIIFILNFSDSESVKLLFRSSLYNCHKVPDVFELLSLYCIKLYIGIPISISLALSISVLFISLLQLIKGVHFLNITPLFLSTCLAAASSPAPVIFIVPLTSMHHYNHIN